MRIPDRLRPFTEALLWAVPASAASAFFVGWLGVAVGAAVAVVHVLIAWGPRAAIALWHIVVLPAIAGVVFSGTPVLLWGFAGPVLAGIWLLTAVPRTARVAKNPRLLEIVTFLLTLVVCSQLPLNVLDEKVGPAEYRGVTLAELCRRLYEDHHILAHVEAPASERVVDFSVPAHTSKRRVLEKLARENALTLDIGYCGTGATLLWGAYPMVASLKAEAAG